MELRDKIKQYIDIKSRIANLQTELNILEDMIGDEITETIRIPIGKVFIYAHIEDFKIMTVPQRYLPHINPNNETASFYDGRVVDMEETPARRLVITIEK